MSGTSSKRIRLREKLGSKEFLEEYRSVREGNIPAKGKVRVPAGRGTLRWLVEQYYQSAEFKAELSERTQYVRRGILENICKLCGSKPSLPRTARRHISSWRYLAGAA